MFVVEPCKDCGAAINADDPVCPMCSAEAMADRAVEAEGNIERKTQVLKPKTTEGYKSLQEARSALRRQLAAITKRQKTVKELIAGASEKYADAGADTEKDAFDTLKSLWTLEGNLSRELSTITDKLNKNAKEMLAYQVERSKIVDQMSPEEQQAQVFTWFRHNPEAMQLFMLQTLQSIFNQCKTQRAARSATKSKARASFKSA